MAIVDFDTAFWSDKDIQKAPPKTKLLHAYLWTNSRKNSICIYEITLKTIMDETGLTEAEIREGIDYFKDSIRYDFDASIVMVLNYFRRQFMRTGNVSPKMLQAAEKNLLSLPINHPFISIFLDYKYYKHLPIPYLYGRDTVSIYRTGGGQGQGKGKEGGVGGYPQEGVDKSGSGEERQEPGGGGSDSEPAQTLMQIAQEKAEIAFREFKVAVEKHVQDGARLVVRDWIARGVYHALGGLPRAREMLNGAGEVYEREWRAEYARQEAAAFKRRKEPG